MATFPDGSTAMVGRSDGAPMLNVNVDGAAYQGGVPDHHAEAGLAPVTLDLDSGADGYVVMQSGGEFAAINLMVLRGQEMVSAGQACFDVETNEYAVC